MAHPSTPWAEALLAVALAALGAKLATRVAHEVRAAEVRQAIRAANGREALRAVGGVDPWGRLVHEIPPAGAVRFVAFLLRAQSIESDLQFWNRVASLLPPGRGVRIVAYCDGALCDAKVRARGEPAAFPVIAFADAVDGQAVINADEDGQLLLLDPNTHAVEKRFWRRDSVGPRAVARTLGEVRKIASK